MKDDISEEDIRKFLKEQLEGEEHDTDTVNKSKKKKKKSRQGDSPRKKRKGLKVSLLEEKQITTEEDKTTFPSATNLGICRPGRPPPKVVVFEEPGKSKGKINSKSSNLRQKDETTTKDSEDIDFLEIARDVKEFGMTGFSKKERRKYEQQKAQALGAKAPKGVKMPYNILIAHQRIQKQKEIKHLKMEKAMGMATKTSKNKNQKKETPTSSKGWWTDKSSKGLDMAIGKYKKGVQTISKDYIKRIKQKKK